MEQVIALSHAYLLIWLKVVTAYSAGFTLLAILIFLLLLVALELDLLQARLNVILDQVGRSRTEPECLNFLPHPNHHTLASYVPDHEDEDEERHDATHQVHHVLWQRSIVIKQCFLFLYDNIQVITLTVVVNVG